MEQNRTSVLSNVLVWFGAGVSIAEIMTGTLFAPLGFSDGITAILVGHIIGGMMMCAAGLIGGFERKSAMETVGMSFGELGGKFFAVLNVIQLIGWTAIMIFDGALSANEIFGTGLWVWALIIGVLILVWTVIGLTNLGRVNLFAMSALLVLTLLMAKVVFSSGGEGVVSSNAMSFGCAVELAAAMPLSWLPLISDYTRTAEKPVAATFASVAVYSTVSIFMYIIGMGAAIFTGESDISRIMVRAGFGSAGLLIIVFSTVTTAFLDVYSAGISSEAVSSALKGRPVSIVTTLAGIVAAIFFRPTDITGFLYFIGSVFAPMIAVQIADYFVLNRRTATSAVDLISLSTWAVGFIVYRLMMNVETPVGVTLIDMVITVAAGIVLNRLFRRKVNACSVSE